ncbi:MAG TPA: PAS domain S-box protein [Thermoanaerobaculia bacterium]
MRNFLDATGPAASSVSDTTTLLDTALSTLCAAAAADGAMVFGRHRRVVASTGLTVDDLRISMNGEERWTGDTSRPNSVARSASALGAGLLVLDREHVAVLLRAQPGDWHPRTIHVAETFVPLLARLLTRERPVTETLLDAIPDVIWMKDLDSRYTFANAAFAAVLGLPSPSAIIGKTDFDLYPHGRAQLFRNRDLAVIAARKPMHFLLTRTEASVTAELIKAPVVDAAGQVIGIVGTSRDLTTHYRALAEEAERLSDTIGNVPGVVWEEWFDGSPGFVSQHIETMMGYTPEEYLALDNRFLSIVHPNDRAAVERSNRAIIETCGGGVHQFRIVTKNGQVRWCESHCRAILDAGGNPIGIRGVSMDITDRKFAEEVLRDSEERVRHIIDEAPVMLWTTNTRGECEFMSRRLLDFLGLEMDESLGSGWIDAVHPDDREETASILRHWTQSRSWSRREVRVRSSDGFRNFLIEAAPRYAADGTFRGLIGSCVDMTERDLLEQRLEERKRLASLGRLAATIAHEVNNVLMGIQPFATVITRTNDREALERAAMHITKAVDRGRYVTHEILRFANGTEPRLQPVDVTVWLQSFRPELQAILGPSVALTLDIAPGLRILADTIQLQQIFTNLGTNAHDAMGGSGQLSIEVRPASPRWTAALPADREYVHFLVRDNGPGIPHAILDHILEPLFTTKTNGTGLGLPIVAEIVRKHGGELEVESEFGEGTCVHIVLPATGEAPAGDETRATGSLPRSIRRILLVEDDLSVADGMATLLGLEGIEVEIAESGAQALEAIQRRPFDLVLLDIGLPDMPGTAVFTHIRALHPDVPILFSTGHGGQAELDMFLKESSTGYLLKPYDLGVLIAAARSLAGE